MASTTQLPIPPSPATGTIATKPAVRTRGPGRLRPNFLGGLGGWLWLAVIIVPIYYVVITSFKNQAGFFTSNPMLAGNRTNTGQLPAGSGQTTSPGTSPTA